ncbi:Winged helix-turn-helix DNA-binding domain [Ostreococcus tauri]|uniref:COP9 signalosome complex subunit 4 n=2 Tax=Ostreococcus tauri TaxID=70448 RepID=A0A090MAY9_OSTTA|nr:Winged helix-turn-helix DNA-binding domain [Ostreococcus tauri]CEF99877.1 Winged helix-turn-helix DNA-binding domain [Ostreococcus tauri]|eukprot:XP_003082315.2 Winged helix-turn-helix DNA-binding domain [Ostreococcus tauri]
MRASELEVRLSSAPTSSDLEGRVRAYEAIAREVVDGLTTTGDAGAFVAFVEHVSGDEVPLTISRAMIEILVEALPRLPFETHRALARCVLEKTTPRVASFERQVWPVRDALATRLIENDRFEEAGDVLAEIESGPVGALSKLEIALKTTDTYVKANRLDKAEKHVNKTPMLLAECRAEEQNDALMRWYHSCWGGILDRMGKYMDAAVRYNEISRLDKQTVEETLTRAAVCLFLAPKGPQKSRMLQTMYKDQSYANLAIFPFIEKVYFDRILRANEVEEMRALFSAHHLESRDGELSSLQRAVIEHNLVSMSGVYNNIGFDQLGELIGVSDVQAEKAAAKMISDDRLTGSIDQVDRIVYFGGDSEPLVEWDEKVVDISLKLNDIVDEMKKKGLVQV